MRITNKRAAIIYALILAFVAGVVFFLVSLGVNGATWASNKANRHIYSGGRIVNAGTIYDINGKVLVPAGFPKMEAAVRGLGYETVIVDTSEYRKIDGGLSCLSLRF